MARPEAPPPAGDDLDALFEADTGMDDIFDTIRRHQADQTDEVRAPQKEVQSGGRKRNDDVGGDVDEEIKITKKRAPIAKLDDTRLLSDNGILKLQKLSRTKFKFKGKGHEFSDVARLLRLYQLWLDDLYPRAKFADGLTIIEKLGHSKRMQMQRKAWIDAGRPKESVEDGEDTVPEAEDKEDPEHVEQPEAEHGGEIMRAASEDSEGSVDPFDPDLGRRREPNNQGTRPNGDTEQDGPDEDELDALLAAEDSFTAEISSLISKPVQQRPPLPQEPSFDDDEEAMRDMYGMW